MFALLKIVFFFFTEQVELSKQDIPPGFKMPTSEKDFMIAAPVEIEEDDNL